MRIAKTEFKRVNEKSVIEDYDYLIRYAANLFSYKISSFRMDYWDLYSEGNLLLMDCLSKWGKEDTNDGEGFSRYFKSALFRRFNQLRYIIAKKDYRIPTDSIDEVLSLKIESDGGFGNVAYEELCNHVASGLRQPDKAIFSLLVNPPINLSKVVLKEVKKREKHITNSEVRLRGKYLLKYLHKEGYPMSTTQFDLSLKRIRSRVKQVLDISF